MEIKRFYQIPKCVIEDNRLNTTEILCFMLIYNRKRYNVAEYGLKYADISYTELCQKLNISNFQIYFALQHLRELGYITDTEKQLYNCNKYYTIDFEKAYYIRFPVDLLEVQELTRNEKLSYCIMYDMFANKNKYNLSKGYSNNEIKIHQSELCKMLRVTTYQAVRNIVKRLKNKGLIDVESCRERGYNSYYVYSFEHLENRLRIAEYENISISHIAENIKDTVTSTVNTVVEKVDNKVNEAVNNIADKTTDTINTAANTANEKLESLKDTIHKAKEKFDKKINEQDKTTNNNTIISNAVNNIAVSEFMEKIREANKKTDELYKQMQEKKLNINWK